MQTIYLIGFMGSGKSTIGQCLSTLLSISQVDTDDFIENKHQKKISEIFKVSGEETFRTYESESLDQVSSYEVVSTGGGIVEKRENIDTMKKSGILIYLQTPFREIVARLESDKSRPLWDSTLQSEMSALYKRRILLYEKYADYIINTENKTIEDIAQEIKTLIRNKE